MVSRLTVPLLAAAAVIFACGPRTPSAIALSGAGRSPGKGVVSDVIVDTANGTVRFVIEVANDTRKRVELNFPSGRTHEFIVLDAMGKEVWRWSEGRMFTQSMQNRLLDAHDSVTYSERWSQPSPGRYTLVAQLNSENYPVQREMQFSLR